MRLRIAAPVARSVSMPSSWKLDSSTTSASRPRASSARLGERRARGCRPRRCAGRRCANSSPVSAVVVLLPLVPVMPRSGSRRRKRAGQLHLAQTGTPAARAPRELRQRQRHARAHHHQVLRLEQPRRRRPSDERHALGLQLAAPRRRARPRRRASSAVTRAPCAQQQLAAPPAPLFASPNTSTF